MSAVLDKKPETEAELLDGIIKLAADKNRHVLIVHECEWLETKLRTIAQFGRRLKRLQTARRQKCRHKPR